MKYLFDTNVISELAKAEPNREVSEWISTLDPENVYISVITLGEIRKGIDRLPEGKRRQNLGRWFEQELKVQFEGRVLDIDRGIAELWGSLGARAKRPLPAVDALIAATAMVHKFKLVTRNTAEFEYQGLRVIDPWGG